MGWCAESLSHIGNVVWNVGTCPDTLSCKTTEKRCVFCLSLPHHSLLGNHRQQPHSSTLSSSCRKLSFKLLKLMSIETKKYIMLITNQWYTQWLQSFYLQHLLLIKKGRKISLALHQNLYTFNSLTIITWQLGWW